ncbi:DUF456 domain-containing protein [Paenibacillus thermoaerophilus]|uniref:DUF456 domain-containing protein n=1 Tax=Paenibacillus thermoaerophilus TaxID=1215385 RepID=A0ABW2V4S0_9BACL|nr:DUF456 family protein [Paenibacillus thermoaerophilus]TMV18414.1 DUF456 family protein [Paenibacillus thermoaerophilus]
MSVLGWALIVLLFAVGMLGAVYPVLPGALAIYAAFFVYGLFFTWEPFGIWFWLIQTTIVVVLFAADYAVSALGVKKFGGSKASVWGSTIGLIVGPFVIPAFGLIIGPFAGAAIGELIAGKDWKQAVQSGLGALVGFFTGTVVKVLLQGLMIVLFIVWIW